MTSKIKVDTIEEKTSSNGVSIDSVTLKDGNVGSTGTETSVAGIPLFSDSSNNSMYTHDVSGTDDTAAGNTAFGFNAMDAITTGDNNVAIGKDAATAMTTASDVICVGENAGSAITIGSNNVMIGNHAGDAMVVEQRCVGIGKNALSAHRTVHSDVQDTGNTAVGFFAGALITTGELNTCIGHNALATRLTTGNKNIGIGSGVNLNNADNSHAIVIGHNIEGNENRFTFGKSGNLVENIFTSNANFAQSSDERLKTDIEDNTLGLDFIDELKTKTYKWKASNELDKDDPQLVQRYDEENQMDTDVLMYGMLAQDVKVLLDKYGHEKFTGWSEDAYGVQNLSREMFVIPLIKAVQELSQKVKELETELSELKEE